MTRSNAKLRIGINGFGRIGRLVFRALVEQGLGRQDAYVLVQRNAMKAFEGQGEFRALLRGDAEIRKYLSVDAIDRQFELNHALAHVDTIIDRVLEGG